MSLLRTPFFRVLHRPRLFLGGEREPTPMMAIVAAGLALSGENLVTLTVAAALWFGCIGIFRQVAKTDRQMSHVCVRQLKYRSYYPPRSRPYGDVKASPRAFYVRTALVGAILPYWMF